MLKRILLDETCAKEFQKEKELMRELCRNDISSFVYINSMPIKEDPQEVLCICSRTDTDLYHWAAGNHAAVLGYKEGHSYRIKYVSENFSGITPRFFKTVYARHHQQPLDILETKRLSVREMTVGDLPALYELYGSHPSVTAYVEPLYPYEEELEFTKKYIDNMYGFFGYGLWLVFEKESKNLIGRIGLSNREIDGTLCAELGFVIDYRYQKKGYAYECCKAVIQYAKEELQMEGLVLCTKKENLPSVKLAKKLGFQLIISNSNEPDVYYYKF